MSGRHGGKKNYAVISEATRFDDHDNNIGRAEAAESHHHPHHSHSHSHHHNNNAHEHAQHYPSVLISDSPPTKIESTPKYSLNQAMEESSQNESSSLLPISSKSKSKSSESSKKAGLLPRLIVYSAITAHGLSMNLPQPFLPQLLTNRWHVPTDQTGFYDGLLMSGFAFASAISAPYVGHLSDKFGRKSLLLLSTAAVTIGTLVFGFAPSVWLAFAARVFEGLLSALPVLSRAALADISEGDPDRNSYFAVFGSVYSLGLSLASAIGGAISGESSAFLPSWMDPNISACVFGAVICFISFLGILTFLPNTRGGDKSGPSTLSVRIHRMTQVERIRFLLGDWVVRRAIIVMALANAATAAVLLSFTLLLTLPSDQDHGQAFSEVEIGLAYLIFGITGFIFQVSLFKKLDKRFGSRKLLHFGVICLIIGSVLLPLSALFIPSSNSVHVWIGVSVSLTILGIGNMNCFPCSTIFLGNAVDAELQGLSQGLGRCLSAFLRALGTLGAGEIFSWSLKYNAPWALFVFIAVLCVLISCIASKLPKYVETGKPRD